MRRAALVLLILLMPVSAFAQEVSRSFAALSRQGVVNEGDTVWMFDVVRLHNWTSRSRIWIYGRCSLIGVYGPPYSAWSSSVRLLDSVRISR